MRSESIINKKIVDENILEKHITNYIHGISYIIAGAFIVLFIADVVISVLVFFGYFPFQLQSLKGGIATYREFLITQIVIQVCTLTPFLIYFISYKRINFEQKKTLLCFLTITTTAVLCFGHWKNQYISFLFAIPVMVTSPLDKKRNVITLIISETLVILYAFFHNIFHDHEINYLVAAISTTTLAMVYVVSLKIHSTLNGLFAEVNDYKNMQEVLYDKIAHDVLTGAYSKTALENDIEDISYYKSIAFLDIDNFKAINDEKGHMAGDSILKLLVICLKSKNIDVYRYGGDEFIILSPVYTATELKKLLETNRKRLYLAAKELYKYEVTLSIGIMNINNQKTPIENIQECDKLMYISKKNGRNQITIDE